MRIFKTKGVRGALCVSLALGAMAPASAAPTIEPQAKWVVDWAEARCTATRTYKVDGQEEKLVLKAGLNGRLVQLYLFKAGSKRAAFQRDVMLSIGAAAPAPASMLSYGAGAFDINLFNLTETQSAALASADRLAVGDGTDAKAYPLSDMAQVVAALDQCRVDLRTTWNADDGAAARLKRPVTGSLMSAFSSGDFPRQALMKGQSGAVTLVVLIDEAGQVADCSVTGTSGVASLDAQSCAIIKARVKMRPAVGLDGKAAKSTITQRVNWKLDNGE